MTKQFYTTEDMQRITGFSLATIYTLIRNHNIPFIRLGKQYLVPVKAFEDFVCDYMSERR